MSLDEEIAAINWRVARRFPVGSREADLVGALEADGFDRSEKRGLCDRANCMWADWRPSRSMYVAYMVFWEADAERKLTSVRFSLTMS